MTAALATREHQKQKSRDRFPLLFTHATHVWRDARDITVTKEA